MANQTNRRVVASSSSSSKQSVIVKGQCIFFLGSPYLGKSNHFEHTYEIRGFERINFEKDRRKTFEKIFNLLSQNQNLVIDDEKTMSLVEARGALIEKIKSEHPQYVIECISFEPKFGDLQIDIAKTFHICEYFEVLDFDMIEQINIHEQFIMDIQASLGENNGQSTLTYPKDEKFDKISKKEMPLFVNRSEIDFSYHTLILDASSSNLFSYDTKKRKIHFKNESKLKELILNWTERSKDTRVIVLYSDRDTFRISLNIPANHINSLNVMHMLRNAIIELGLPSPVYYCTDSESRDYFLLFCQLFYIYSIKMDESLFISDRLVEIPKSVFRLFPNISSMDFNTLLSIEDFKSYICERNNQQQPLSERITLEFNPNAKNVEAPRHRRYPLLNLLSESENLTDEPYMEYNKRGMSQGIVLMRQFISYFEYREDFFEAPEQHVLNDESQRLALFGDDDLDRMEDDPEEEDENPLERLKRLKELYNRTRNIDSQGRSISNNEEQISRVENSTFAVKDPFGRSSSTVAPANDGMELSTTSQIENAYNNQATTTNTVLADSKVLSALVVNMSIHQVMNHFGMTFFQRGRDYKNEYRIDNFKTKIINDIAFKLYSTCIGTRPEPYKQESIIKEGRLLKAICNCPIGSEGTCKHVCAQVLAFREKDKYMKEKFESLNSSKADRYLPPPIAFSQLDPVLDDWCIKVKVVKKHNEKAWANERGSGRVAAITIADELSGDISLSSKQNRVKLIMFNDCINEFYDQMEEGESYYVNKGHLIKKPHEEFFEIQLCTNTVVRNIHQLNVKFKDQNNLVADYQKIFQEKLQSKSKGIEFEEYPLITSDQASTNSFIAPSPEKKRKLEQFYIPEQENDEPAVQEIIHESPIKKTKLPSVDTRFDEIMNAPTLSSQQSIIASQPISTTSNDSVKSQIITTPASTKSQVIVEEEVFVIDDDDEEAEEMEEGEIEDGPIFTSDFTQKPTSSNPQAQPSDRELSEKVHPPSQNKLVLASNNNSQKSNHSSNSSSTPTPKPHYYFDENEESQTFEDIFFTPFKTPQTNSTNKTTPSSTFSLNTKLGNILIDDEHPPFYNSEQKTKDLIPDDDVQEIVNSQQSLTREPMSPQSLSEHNKPPVLDCVVLSDNDEVEVLDYVTPRKSIKRKTNKSPSPKPQLFNIPATNPKETSSSISRSSNSNMDESTNSTPPNSSKTPKKVSLKFLLDNNDLTDL